jgi:beta-glucosidase
MTGSTAAAIEDDLDRRVTSLSLAQKVRLLTGADFWSLHPEPAIGLRRLVLSDGPAGVRGERWDERDPSANVPSPTALAATWDEARVHRLGELLAAEARAKQVDVLLAPTINLHRSPYGGRHFEAFSEDPYLTARIGIAYVRGLQAGGVAATPKHFVANDSETERFTVDVRVDERTLRELYLLPFELIVAAAGPWAVMAAYNSVGGTTMTEHPLLRDVLTGEWGFDGLVMTDWHAGRSTEPAANAALDLIMPGPDGPWGDALIEAVRAGRVSEQAVDEKVHRLLRLAARVGALDGIPPAAPATAVWPADAVAAELRASAAAGFVLVRNEPATGAGAPLLPLDRAELRQVAVLGPNAEVARTLGGGSATVFPAYTVSPLDGLRTALRPDVSVQHRPGVSATDRLPAAPVNLLRHPDTGEPGLEVRFLAGDGAVLAREDRGTAAFTWLGSYTPDLPIADVPEIEVHARLSVPETGTYLVGAAGLGEFRLSLDGKPVLDTRIALPPGADPVEGIMRPPQQAVRVELRAGDDTELVLWHRPGSGGGFGDSPLDITTFQLNAAALPPGDDLDRAVALAAAADVAVVVVGTTEEVESEGFDRDSLALPGRQDELVRRVAAANPRTVVVVNAGAPVLLPWADQVPAVLLTWFPGQEFGNALADVLLGTVEPGGRLPTTWPASARGLPGTRPVDGTLRYDEGLSIGYRDAGRDARYPFGHGLGYTRWEFRSVEVEDRAVRVTVRNSGERPGREVVQVYLSRPDSAVPRPVRWLAAFAPVEAAAGAAATVTVDLPERAFAYWEVASGTWVTEPGRYPVQVGPSSADLPLQAAIDLP